MLAILPVGDDAVAASRNALATVRRGALETLADVAFERLKQAAKVTAKHAMSRPDGHSTPSGRGRFC
jgi:hypothetical protein